MNDWIPIRKRPMSEDEREFYKEAIKLCGEVDIFDCLLPDDGQEVIISVNGVTEIDTFVRDENGCYFEGRDIDDVTAWMPLPEPYKGEVIE